MIQNQTPNGSNPKKKPYTKKAAYIASTPGSTGKTAPSIPVANKRITTVQPSTAILFHPPFGHYPKKENSPA